MYGPITIALFMSLMALASSFVIPAPSKIVSGRAARSSTSQVVMMGRGDTRTTKGKRMRHSYGKCRPQKKGKNTGPAPVARRWENIEYVESEITQRRAAASEASSEDVSEENLNIPQTDAAMLEPEPVSLPDSESGTIPAGDGGFVDGATEEPAEAY